MKPVLYTINTNWGMYLRMHTWDSRRNSALLHYKYEAVKSILDFTAFL